MKFPHLQLDRAFFEWLFYSSMSIDIIHLDRDWKRARRPIDITLCWAGTMQVAVSWPMLKELTVY